MGMLKSFHYDSIVHCNAEYRFNFVLPMNEKNLPQQYDLNMEMLKSLHQDFILLCSTEYRLNLVLCLYECTIAGKEDM